MTKELSVVEIYALGDEITKAIEGETDSERNYKSVGILAGMLQREGILNSKTYQALLDVDATASGHKDLPTMIDDLPDWLRDPVKAILRKKGVNYRGS